MIDQFGRELRVEYRGERYVVRDNGAVCRLPKEGQRKRQLDSIWTFGTPNTSTGYMCVSSVVVHRIVATAFHGEAPSEKHIVDHIDTNRRNNRPENLRWITRLDNILQNPITQRRIILAYGSLDAFFADPSNPLDPKPISDFGWMRTVSKQEAEQSLDRLRRWAASEDKPSGGALGEWIYGQKSAAVQNEESDVAALTPNAMQRNWRVPTEFPLCPETLSLRDYAERCSFGAVFARNHYGQSLIVLAWQGPEVLNTVLRLPDNPIKGWAAARVTLEDGRFVHESVGTYFSLHGALKKPTELMGSPSAPCFDDFA